MPLTAEQKKLIRNHFSTIPKDIGIFLTIIDLEIDEQVKKDVLIELLDKIEKDLVEVKQIIENLEVD